ncbi:hypothetical protein DFS34DRAFT_133472 [Phlyctochytrium arcticum]|nr:hypothetical protein DFS34DRAFT_133472 [Phlyctochytrium arcticum]
MLPAKHVSPDGRRDVDDSQGTLNEGSGDRLDNSRTKIRVPLSVLFMLTTMMVAGALSVTIGVISIEKGNQSIAVASQNLRTMTLNRAVDRVRFMFSTASSLLALLANSTIMYSYLNDAPKEEVLRRNVLDNPDVISLHWQIAQQNAFLGACGFYFEANSNYMATYSLAKFIAYSDDTTRAIVPGASWAETGARCNDTYEWDDPNYPDYRGSCVMNSMRVGGLYSNNSVQYIGSVVSRPDWNLTRLWPQVYQSSGQPVWGGITYSTNNVLRTFLMPLIQPIWYRQPLRAPAAQPFYAAQFVTITLKSLETYLPAIIPTANAILTLLDTNGIMIASSIVGAAADTATGQRYRGYESPNRIIAQTLRGMYPEYAQENGAQAYRVAFNNSRAYSGSHSVDGAEYLTDRRWITDIYGLRWMVILVIPRSDFFRQVDMAKRQIVFACIGLGIAGFAIAIATSLIIILPIRRLNHVMNEATNFDFSALRSGYMKTLSPFLEIAQMETSFSLMLSKFADAIQSNRQLNQRKRSNNSAGGQTPSVKTAPVSATQCQCLRSHDPSPGHSPAASSPPHRGSTTLSLPTHRASLDVSHTMLAPNRDLESAM